MIRIWFTILFIASCSYLHAQQVQGSAFFDQYGVMFNPATAASRDAAFVGGSFRSQWSSIPGAPQTTSLYGAKYFARTHTGISSYLYNDVTGPTRRTGIQLAYAYRLQLEKAALSFGLEARMQQFAIDAARFESTVGGNDPVFAGDHNQLKGDAGAGVMFTTKRLTAGVSVSQLVQSKLKWTSKDAGAQGRLYRHYYALGSYNWDLDEVTSVTPNFLFTYLPNAPSELQGGIRVEHNQSFWYGLGWRMRQSWMISAGVKIKKQFSIGYSFDMYNKPLNTFEAGSNAHEVQIRYEFNR